MDYRNIASAVFVNDESTESVRVSATINSENVRAFVWVFGGGLRVTCFSSAPHYPAPAYRVNEFVAGIIGESVKPKLDSFVTNNL